MKNKMLAVLTVGQRIWQGFHQELVGREGIPGLGLKW